MNKQPDKCRRDDCPSRDNCNRYLTKKERVNIKVSSFFFKSNGECFYFVRKV